MDSNSKNQFWDIKPYWCQPWSIITFGILILVFSWRLFNNLIITLLLSLVIIGWWVIFLLIVPRSYQSISEQNNKD